MSEQEPVENPPDGTGDLYEALVNVDDGRLEHLTLARVINLAQAPPNNIPRELLNGLACRIFDTRRLRARFFNNSLLGEPVWDMLLALYCLPSRNESMSVTGLCHAAGVPVTTGLRWAQLMEQKGLVERRRDPRDGRRVHMVLTGHGDQLMSSYLSMIFHKLTVR